MLTIAIFLSVLSSNATFDIDEYDLENSDSDKFLGITNHHSNLTFEGHVVQL